MKKKYKKISALVKFSTPEKNLILTVDNAIEKCAYKFKIKYLTEIMGRCRNLTIKKANVLWQETMWRMGIIKEKPKWIKRTPVTIRFKKNGRWSDEYLADDYIKNGELIPI